MVTGSRSQRKRHAPIGAVLEVPNRKLLVVAGREPMVEVRLMQAYSCQRDFEVGVGITPKQGTRASQYFRLIAAGTGKLLRSQKADGSGKFGAGDFSADGAGGDLNLRVVADTLRFPQSTVRHEVEFVVVFGKPNGRVHGYATFSEGGEADVTLAADFGRNGRHANIVKRREGFLVGSARQNYAELPRRLF